MSQAKALAAIVRDFFARQIEPILGRITALEQRTPQPGVKGDQGGPGPDGRSAYEIACAAGGFDGTEVEWLLSLRGAPGRDGNDGQDGRSITLDELAPIVARAIDEAVARIPSPKDGKDGVDGKDGKDGESVTLEHVTELVRAAVAEIPAAPAGKDGRDGSDGKSVALEDVAPVLQRYVAEAFALIRVPKDGRDGKDGHDGESIHPDTVRAMVADHVRLAVADIPRPRDGEPGRDATAIEYRDGVDETKSYPRGTHALHRGGVIVAMRATDPLAGAADLTAAGWAVAMNGTHTDVEESLDDGRTIRRTLTMTNGKVIVSERRTAIAIYRGVWRHDTEYSRGDMATRDGSVWHCEHDGATKDEPGKSTAWRLAVKRGNHGRDGKDAK